MCTQGNGTILGVGMDNQLWTRATMVGNWVLVPNSGSVKAVDVLASCALLGVGMDNFLWTRATLTSPWNQVPNSCCVTDVTVLGDGTILGIGMDSGLWTRATMASGWVQVPSSGSVKALASLCHSGSHATTPVATSAPAAASGAAAPADTAKPVPTETPAPTAAPTPQAPPPAPPAARLVVSALDCKNELVTITNEGESTVDLGGWKIHDRGAEYTYTFQPGTTLAPGASVSLRSGKTKPKAGEIGWTDRNIWNNEGDTATLVDPSGAVVSTKDS